MREENLCVLRKTESMCPVCQRKIKADIIQRQDKVYMIKDCIDHGHFEVLISNHAWYYKELTNFYFSLIQKPPSQRNFLIYLTDRCNLNCPICLNGINFNPVSDISIEDIKNFIKDRKGLKLNLMGAEPTMRKDLSEIIKFINKSGNKIALHTNGIKIANIDYLKRLVKAGLKEVHLQFDGFDDRIYLFLRGKKLLDIKLRALDNLKRLNIATHIKATVAKGINEKEIIKILDFGVDNDFIREVGFLGMRYLGKAKSLPYETCMLCDELVDLLVEQTNGKISRENIFIFQKMYYTLLSLFSVRKCCYNQHFLITRQKGGYVPIDRIINLQNIQKKLDRFWELRIKGKKIAFLYLLVRILPEFLTINGISFLKDFLISKLSLISNFDLSKFPKTKILLSFITICDPYIIDYHITQNCCYGEISDDLGVQDTAVLNLFLRKKINL